MSEVIVITSGKGGVGKTTTTANIGIGLAKLGKKVLVIDTDLGLRNLDVVLGLENRIVYNLVDVIEGKCRPKQAIIKDKRFQDLYLLPSAQTKDKSSVSPEQMKKLTEDLREDYDFVSSISITAIAAATKRPDKFIGMHFFNPATVMKLVEVIRGAHTSDETYKTIAELAAAIGKEPVEVNEAPGFVVNKILVPMINEGIDLVYTGVASVEGVDTAIFRP